MSQGDAIDTIARNAAARLADIDPALPDQVERALAADELEQPADRFVDPISLAALVVSIASLGWTIYHDIRKDRAVAEADHAEKIRRVTDELREDGVDLGRVPPNLTPERRARIITVVATEIVAADSP